MMATRWMVSTALAGWDCHQDSAFSQIDWMVLSCACGSLSLLSHWVTVPERRDVGRWEASHGFGEPGMVSRHWGSKAGGAGGALLP